MVDRLRVKECQLNFIQLAPPVPCVPAPIQQRSLGTNTDSRSPKVSDASTQMPDIYLARRTGKVWYPPGHPNHVETKQPSKKRRPKPTNPRRQCEMSTPRQVVTPVPPNRQECRMYLPQQQQPSSRGGYIPTVSSSYIPFYDWWHAIRTIMFTWINISKTIFFIFHLNVFKYGSHVFHIWTLGQSLTRRGEELSQSKIDEINLLCNKISFHKNNYLNCLFLKLYTAHLSSLK